MKNILLSIFFLAVTSTYGQQLPDQTRTNCNSQTETLYDALDANKVVLVAADAFDCSICMAHAPSIGTYASNNPNIKIWGAMGFKFSTNTPTCTQVNGWVNSYNWDNVFSFVDANRSWAGNGYPTYTVIDPRDKSIAYRGTSHTQAMNRATEISNTITTVFSSPASSPGLSANCCNRTVTLNGFENPVQGTVFVQELSGRRIETRKNVLLSNGSEIQLSEKLPRGNYIVLIQLANKTMIARIMVTDYE